MMRGPLNELGDEILAVNRANGWEVLSPEAWAEPRHVPGALALIHSEVSEALEGFRGNDKANFEEEMADTLIRVLDCACGLGIDMDAAVARKLAANRLRGFRHGGKRL